MPSAADSASSFSRAIVKLGAVSARQLAAAMRVSKRGPPPSPGHGRRARARRGRSQRGRRRSARRRTARRGPGGSAVRRTSVLERGLFRPDARVFDYVDRAEAERMRDAYLARGAPHGARLWSFLLLETWLRRTFTP